MRFGFMLRKDIFWGDMHDYSIELCNSFDGRGKLLDYLGKNVDTVELHTITHSDTPEDLYNTLKLCWSYGLFVTIHGQLRESDTPTEFFKPYNKIFSSGLQKEFNITLHPLNYKKDTIDVLKKICDYAEDNNLPVKFTLENQRYKDEYSKDGTCKSVGEIVKYINSSLLNTCFDFGHFLSNKVNYSGLDLMTDEFRNKIKHTHIHSFFEGRTHFPLDCGKTELEENIGMLTDMDYDGILSLEISFARFLGKIDFRDALCNSIFVLKTAYEQVIRKKRYEEIFRYEYAGKIKKILENIDGEKDFIGQLVSAAYIVKMGDTKVVVDPSLSMIDVNAQGRQELKELIKKSGNVIITHKHHDHFDKDIIKELSSADIKWYIPDFFEEKDLEECGLKAENVIFIKRNNQYVLGEVKINVFESAHSHLHETVPEYGFSLEYRNKQYLFLGDVRTYDINKFRTLENTECLFSHLWLGKANALNVNANDFVDKFCDFVNHFGAKKVYIAHLFDVRRTIKDMWSDIHFDMVKNKINNPVLFELGECYEI